MITLSSSSLVIGEELNTARIRFVTFPSSGNSQLNHQNDLTWWLSNNQGVAEAINFKDGSFVEGGI
jgi:hypothetical protein